MKKFAVLVGAAVLSAFGAPIAAVAAETATVPMMIEVKRGDMLYSGDGKRLSNVYRVTEEGNAQIIFRGKMLTISSETLSEIEGKLTTSLTRSEVQDLA